MNGEGSYYCGYSQDKSNIADIAPQHVTHRNIWKIVQGCGEGYQQLRQGCAQRYESKADEQRGDPETSSQ